MTLIGKAKPTTEARRHGDTEARRHGEQPRSEDQNIWWTPGKAIFSRSALPESAFWRGVMYPL